MSSYTNTIRTSNNNAGPGLSQLPGNPSFRNAAVNAVAIVPLLSSSSSSLSLSRQHQNQNNTNNNNIDSSTITTIHSNSNNDDDYDDDDGMDRTATTTSLNNESTTSVHGDNIVTDDNPARAPNPTHSIQSFNELMSALNRHHYCHSTNNKASSSSSSSSLQDESYDDDFVLVVPNSSLTRPGEWRYDTTPLSSFHWQHGCQRLWIMDGRPPGSSTSSTKNNSSNSNKRRNHRQSHDRLLNHSISRNWIDLYPCRRTAAVVGVLSMNDCTSIDDFHRAEEELHQWAMQYSTPPYIVTSRGQNYPRDVPIERLFVYDSFTEQNSTKIDISSAASTLGSNRIFAFPPELPDVDHATNVHLLNLHLNVVINDLAVTVFRDLENKIKEYQDIMNGMSAENDSLKQQQQQQQQSAARRAIKSMMGSRSNTNSSTPATGTSSFGEDSKPELAIGNMAGLVNPESKLAKDSPSKDTTASSSSSSSVTKGTTSRLSDDSSMRSLSSRTTGTTSITTAGGGLNFINHSTSSMGKLPSLLTPLDDEQQHEIPLTSMTAKDVDAMKKREIGRREKWCGDLSLLAGSPLDAYEHYLKAAELLSSRNPSSIGNTGSNSNSTTNTGNNTNSSISGSSSSMTSSLTLDPLWHACALEGCAAAHIAMADGGGYNVDEYLENNFQLPEEVMVSLISYQTSLLSSSTSSSALSGTATGPGSGATDDNAVTTSSKRVSTGLKQTLPEVVFTLCEESLSILSRNHVLSHLYAELLLKLARYCADAAEGHLRCIWGMGDGCYSGVDSGGIGNNNMMMMMMNQDGEDTIPRWLRTSTSKLLSLSSTTSTSTMSNKNNYNNNPKFVLPTGLQDMATVNTVFRTKKVCELLHAAVSIGTLDPATRVDIAAHSTVLCLQGIKPTNWRGFPVERVQLPRKAAYFSVVAAETLTAVGKSQNSLDLWLLATRLYSRNKNPLGGIGGNYGWATLRAHCLEALSMHGNCRTALEASSQLLSLLSELVPNAVEESNTLDNDESLAMSSRRMPKKKNTGSSSTDDVLRVSRHDLVISDSDIDGTNAPGFRSDFGIILDDTDIRDAVANASQFARNLRDTYRITVTNAATALLTNNQPKWSISGDAASHTMPFGPIQPQQTPLQILKSVWPVVPYNTSVSTQKYCLERISVLRRSLPTVSGTELPVDTCPIYGTEDKKLPLYVSFAMAIQADSALEMECVKKNIIPDKSKQGAMATFFNPFEAKKTVKSSTVRVAEEEERAMRIEFGNRLSLPLEIQRSQLVFANDYEGRVKAASLSFVIPPRAMAFTVQFPFTVLSKPTSAGDGHDDNSDLFEVKGLEITCFGRSFFLPVQELNANVSLGTETGNLPESASTYPYRAKKKDVILTEDMKPRVETFPCQPRLHVLFAETGAVADRFSVGLSDGEIYTIPPFRLENYMGPSARGKIERLEIYSANIPSVSDKKLYDSDAGPIVDVDEATFVKDLIWKENSAPLVLRALTGSLKISAVNGSHSSYRIAEESIVTLQIAASHNLGERIPIGTTIHIRFRYRGLSNSSTEVWRKREVLIHVTHAKGPRISSIAFRPDLATGCALMEMKQAAGAAPRQVKIKKNTVAHDELEDDKENEAAVLLKRVGMDNEINVCCGKSYFVLTVANETRSVLSLERIDGPVGGFESHPLEIVTVRPGVSAKIPVVIDRLRRIDENGSPVDIVSELVSRTSLVWKSHRGGEAGPVKARGNIRIPPACLKEIILENPSLLSHICQPPCSIQLVVGKPVSSNEDFIVSLGRPVDVSVNVQLESWIPKDVIENCVLTIEFRCGRMGIQGAPHIPSSDTAITNTSTTTTLHNATSSSREYFWAGKLRHSIPMNSTVKQHRAKIAFCVVGRYAVSACVKISNRTTSSNNNREEVWWAPMARKVVVEESKQPIQW